MTDRELMQQALDILEKIEMGGDPRWASDITPALLARLAQPEQEPVAWMTHHDNPLLFPTNDEALRYCNEDEEPQPLYAAPPQREENHDGEKFVYRAITRSGEIAHFGVYSAAKAWAKSGTVEEVPIRTFKVVQKPCSSCESLARAVMLDQTYHENIIAQRKWQGLTDEEANELVRGYSDDAITLLYETEAKLKEKNGF